MSFDPQYALGGHRFGRFASAMFTAPAAALMLTATACGGADQRPFTGCPSPDAVNQPAGPTADTVEAGQSYSTTLHFPNYPCVQELEGSCRWEFDFIFPHIVCDEVQGSCFPDVLFLQAPSGAYYIPWAIVAWPTTTADEGHVAAFEVQAIYSEGCASQTHAWTVTVLPGP